MLKQIIKLILSFFKQAKGAVVAGVPGKIRKPVQAKQIAELIYLVNVRFSQVNHQPKISDSYNDNVGVGLQCYVESAMAMVKKKPVLMKPEFRYDFLKQDPKKTAEELCSSIGMYIVMLWTGVKVPTPEMWYIETINNGGICADDDGNFVWRPHSSRGIANIWMSSPKLVEPLKHNKNFTNGPEMIEAIKDTGITMGMAWKGTKTKYQHNYIWAMVEDVVVRFDTYHHNKTNTPVADAKECLWWIYAYK